MSVLADYTEFEGRHDETGSSLVRNVLAYHHVVAPHTGQPPTRHSSGLSGGIAFGYFLFDYGGPGRR